MSERAGGATTEPSGGAESRAAGDAAAVTTSLIVAAARNDVIGRDGDLPWHLPGDLRRFREATRGHVVVAGRATHESIVARLGRPLPGRITVAVSRTPRPAEGPVIWQPTPLAALGVALAIEAFAGGDEVFVIGGAAVYRELLPHVDRIHLTRIDADVDGDARLDAAWLAGFRLVRSEPGDAPAPAGPAPAGSAPAGPAPAGSAPDGAPTPLPHTFEVYERQEVAT